MAARAIASGTISFGLVSIPVKLFTATSGHTVRFNQLHEECNSRVKQQLYCPVHEKVVNRDELVKGYEYSKGQYVVFSEDELKQLDAEKTHAIEILEFVGLDSVDPLFVEKTYYLGPDKGGAKAYQLLSTAMEHTGKIAVARYMTRGKEQLVLVRPYKEGLLLHQIFYADEVRAFGDVELGDKVNFKDNERKLADQLIEQLSTGDFKPEEHQDTYRERLMEAVEQKVAGQELKLAPEAPKAQIIDLFDALKASLGDADKAAKKAPRKPLKKTQPARGRKKKAGSAS